MAKPGFEPWFIWLKKDTWPRLDIEESLRPELEKACLDVDSKGDHTQNSLKSRGKRGSPLGGC